MAFVDEATAKAYREAWDAWSRQVEHVHRVFLEGEPIRPDQIKGLLNREARAKEKYDAARLRLLGVDEAPPAPANPDDNPFR
ncbi:MAG: hypothetical protein M9925_16075 [Chloroflexi bacterium]|jgi:hypothetical protein|nr:hypothetical protein [Dehalococcoidia bacterium]MCO5203203.1 hypothetical protein [Chloroflexota bacterium]MCZ7576351.1 hypothetical protein [Dehalococcoidia bacterium]PWB71936.1 MAG: hypothetical protein C3F15_11970 [Holophagae bacterium]